MHSSDSQSELGGAACKDAHFVCLVPCCSFQTWRKQRWRSVIT
ncbi:hypothetical protein KSS87_009873 [Heliosperma pusillum]|nr:hypothetical protein KSS87_009873 [Heliosperma pusillum]